MKRLTHRAFALCVAAVTVFGAQVTLASAAVPQTQIVRDKAGDTLSRGKRVSERPDADLRSVTLTRTTKTLRIVVVTAARMRPDAHLLFRFVTLDGFDIGTLDAKISRGRRAPLVYLNSSRLLPDAARVSGSRLTLTIDIAFYWSGQALDGLAPPFMWIVALDAPPLPGVRDTVPSQPAGYDPVVNPKYVRFP